MSAPEALVQVVLATLKENAETANRLADSVSANTVDKGKLVFELRNDENSEHEQIRAYQAFKEDLDNRIEAATRKIDEWITQNLVQTQSEGVDVDALKAEFKEARKQYATTLAFFSQAVGDDEKVKALLSEAEVPEVKNLRGGTSSAGASGIKRPRVERIWVNGSEVRGSKEVTRKDGSKETVDYTNFTLAAQTLAGLTKPAAKVSPKDLHEAAFAAAKTDDLNSLNGQPVDFDFTVKNSEGATVLAKVRVQPKDPNAADSE